MHRARIEKNKGAELAPASKETDCHGVKGIVVAEICDDETPLDTVALDDDKIHVEMNGSAVMGHVVDDIVNDEGEGTV